MHDIDHVSVEFNSVNDLYQLIRRYNYRLHWESVGNEDLFGNVTLTLHDFPQEEKMRVLSLGAFALKEAEDLAVALCLSEGDPHLWVKKFPPITVFIEPYLYEQDNSISDHITSLKNYGVRGGSIKKHLLVLHEWGVPIEFRPHENDEEREKLFVQIGDMLPISAGSRQESRSSDGEAYSVDPTFLWAALGVYMDEYECLAHPL